MKKLFYFATIALFALSLTAFKGKDKKKKGQEKPNIIFLLSDDQHYSSLGCYGNDEIQTPNIDKLAAEGTIFTNTYNPTAICMGARASIMTGMYEHKTGCNFAHGPLSNDKFQKSYPVLLRNAGYYTGFAGKFGYAVTPTADHRSAYKTNEQMPIDQFDWWKGWPSQGEYETAKNEFLVEYAEEYPHVTKALGAASVDFLKEASKQDKPFCLSVSYKAPHGPVKPDPVYDDVYSGKEFTKPENYWMDGAEHLPIQAKSGRQYVDLKKRWKPEKYHESVAQYYQLIHAIDVSVGMIMEELKEQGLLENTIIIYTTDNGYFCGAHAMGGKVLPYEEGAKAPLIIYTPDNKMKGKTTHALTATIDLAPTMLEYAGVEVPSNMDGESLVPILNKKKKEVKEHQMIIQAWGANPSQALTVLADDHKYIYWFYGEGMTPHEELYNLKNDPFEMNNIAKDESSAATLSKMHKIYDGYVANWDNECVKNERSNYKDYATLYDRNIPWEQKRGIMKEKDPLKSKEKKKGKKKGDKKGNKGNKGNKKGKKQGVK